VRDAALAALTPLPILSATNGESRAPNSTHFNGEAETPHSIRAFRISIMTPI